MSLMEALIYGLRDVMAGLVLQNRHSRINFGSGLTVTEDIANDCQTVTAGAGSVPTGTGIPHIVGGVQNAAASLIVNADVDAAAAIAGTKISPLFGTQAAQCNSVDTSAGALFTLGGANATSINVGVFGRSTNVSGSFTVGQTAAITGALTAPSLDTIGATALTLGGTPGSSSGNATLVNIPILDLTFGDSTTGNKTPYSLAARIRLPYHNAGASGTYTVMGRRSNTGLDKLIISVAGDALTFGDTGIATTLNGVSLLGNFPSAAGAVLNTDLFQVAAYTGGASILRTSTTQVLAGKPIVGDSVATSPYAVHGGVTSAFATGTVAAASYALEEFVVTGSPGGTQTATFPNPATLAAAYSKDVRNAYADGSALVISVGAGATVSIPALQTARVKFENSNVYRIGAAAAY